MALISYTKWRCDRCEVEHDRKPATKYNVDLSFTCLSAGEYSSVIIWKDCCDECNEYLIGVMNKMKKDNDDLKESVMEISKVYEQKL